MRERQEFAEPPARHLLDDRGRRASGVEAGVLVPRRRQPVRRKCGRNPAADHEAEVAAARHRDEPCITRCGERLDHGRGILRLVGKRNVEPLLQFGRRHLRKHRPVVE